MTNTVEKRIRPFNHPVELGLRCLYILSAASPQWLDLQRLSYLDYLLVHSGDVSGGPASLHAAVPNRSGEWLVKRQLLELGLRIMVERELVGIHFTESGISYASTELSAPFLSHMRAEYATALHERALWLKLTFGAMTMLELESFMVANLSKWGSEQKYKSAFEGGSFG